MKHPGLRALMALIPLALVSTGLAAARDLTFEERVEAQAAIDRVYYSHQIGATKPFEEAVPRAVLEVKVRKYLQQTVALETYWKTRVTDEMLQREMERMARGTRLPDRLRELFAALNEDPFVIKECLARATLVDRLARNFFAFDPGLHAEARQRAEEIHRQLAAGEIDFWNGHPDRTVVELVEREGDTGEPPEREDGLPKEGQPSRRLLSPEEFRKERARWPKDPGSVSPVAEEREAFVIRVALSDAPGESRLAAYAVPKRAWDLWWEAVKGDLRGEEVAAALSVGGSLPLAVRSPTGVPVASRSLTDAVQELLHEESSQSTTDDTWDNGILDDLPDPREGHTVAWTGSLMVVWGGMGSQYFNTGGRYDPATDTWTPTSTVGAPSGRSSHTAAWTGTLMIVWGGSDGSTTLNTGGRYDPATDSWTPTSTMGAPSERRSHTGVWTGDLMVVWGGYGAGFLSTGGRYNPAADTWTPTSAVGAPSARGGHTAVWTGTLMIVWGGYDGTYLNTGGRYNPAADFWTSTSTAGAPSGRMEHTAVWTGTLMIIWGGQTTFYFNTGGRYDPVTNSWSPTQTYEAPSPRTRHTAVWTGTVMVVWGGNQEFANGGRYDPAMDFWTPTSTVGAPVPRDEHTAVWTGSLMIVWGGCYFDPEYGYLDTNTGGRYDPATDSWTPTSTAGAPTGRSSHTAVWTGTHVVVWGGCGGDYLNTGGRYDPATDSWTSTSTVDAPSGRVEHTAVWTGTLMVVWGGYYYDGVDTSYYLNTGGRYNPLTDSWTPTSTVGAPSGRFSHAAVWTGTLMVVWGGHDSSTAPNTGGRYDPATDSWTPTSTVGAPSGRRSHTGIWTGDLMVVWGGYGGGFLNTGGRYDPATDTWTSTSTAGAPTGRSSHTAVWTGTHMVVWGGVYDDGASIYLLNTGGRYDPANESWTPTSTVGVPYGRYLHTAVWTGTAMVVWGGCYFDPEYGYLDTDSGGLYAPATDSWTSTSTAGAPSGREEHTAVWTGTHMVVWGGGWGYLNTGGRYIPPDDGDGDGYIEWLGDCDDANAAVYPGAPQICDGLNNDCSDPAWPSLAGTNEYDDDGDTLSECQDDCDDVVAATYPGAIEVNDGLDNQCDGDVGFGIVDEITGALVFSLTEPGEFCWPAQDGATLYQVIRSIFPSFLFFCVSGTTEVPCWTDTALPGVGLTFYYRVRPIEPYVGSWGVDSNGDELIGLCGEE